MFGSIMHIKAVCLHFDKAEITDFDIISKMFSKKGILIFFHFSRKMLENHWEENHSFFFTHVPPQRLAILAVPFKDKDKNSQRFPAIAGNFSLIAVDVDI